MPVVTEAGILSLTCIIDALLQDSSEVIQILWKGSWQCGVHREARAFSSICQTLALHEDQDLQDVKG